MSRTITLQLHPSVTETACRGCEHLGSPINSRWCMVYRKTIHGPTYEEAKRLPECTQAETGGGYCTPEELDVMAARVQSLSGDERREAAAAFEQACKLAQVSAQAYYDTWIEYRSTLTFAEAITELQLHSKLTLGEVIAELEKHDPNKIVVCGFGVADSYRGYYDEVAFEPASNVSVGSMLENARIAVGSMYVGYKGGEYWMDQRTPCNIAEYGESNGHADALTKARLLHMLESP